MKAICELTDEEYQRYKAIESDLCAKTMGMSKSQMFIDYQRRSGYAKYEFSGTVSPALIEKLGRMPTGIEIIILVDNGFSHFGASCGVSETTGRFHGHVYTD